MKAESIDSDVAKEFLLILSYCDDSFLENIPSDILIKLNYLAADSFKDFYIDKNKPLIMQNISNECMELLGYMYYEYMPDGLLREEMLKLCLEE